MANTVGTLEIKLRAEIAEFRSDMGKAAREAEKTAAQMKREMKKQSEEARDSVDLLSDAIGIRLPREMKVAIAESRGFAAIMSKIGNFSMFAAGAGIILQQLVPAIKEATTWLGGYTEEVRRAEEAQKRLNREQMTTNERLKQLKRENELIGLTGADRTRQELAQKRADIAAIQAEIEKKNAEIAGAISRSSAREPVQYRSMGGGMLVRDGGEFTPDAIKAQESVKNLNIELRAHQNALSVATREAENLSKQLSVDLKNGAQQSAVALKSVADEIMHIRTEIPGNMAEIDRLASAMSAWGDQLKTVEGLVTGGGDEVTEFWRKYDEEAKKVVTTSNEVAESINEDILAMRDFGAEVGHVAGQATLFGRSWRDAFESIIVAAVKLLAQMTIMKSLSKYEGQGGVGGFFSALLGGFFGGARATGGPVTAGQMYMVGEEGPEPFIPSQNGYILPHGSMPVLAAAGGTSIHYHIDARGADAGVEMRVMRALKSFEDRAVARSVRTVQEIARRS